MNYFNDLGIRSPLQILQTLDTAIEKAMIESYGDKFILTKPFTGSKWRPIYVDTQLGDNLETSRTMSTKIIADVVEALIGAGYGSAGERCMAISAVVAVGEAGDTLVAKIRDKAKRLKVGPGDKDGMEMGPLVTREHRDRVKEYVDIGEKEGADIVVDGRGLQVKGYEGGHFLGPTLFDKVTTDMKIYQDEIFGPVLVVIRAENYSEAIDIVNQNAYGNGTAVFTQSGEAARRFENEIQVGMVGINVPIPVPMAFFSFGGWKSSLFGDLHVHGMEGVKFYTRTKVITTRWPERPESASLTMPTMK